MRGASGAGRGLPLYLLGVGVGRKGASRVLAGVVVVVVVVVAMLRARHGCCCWTRWESLKPLNSCFAGVAARLLAIVADMCDAVSLIVWYCGICRERYESRRRCSKALPTISAEL